KIQPMVLPAAAAHCVLVEDPQPGRGLPGVEDACPGPGNRIHEFASQGGDAAQPLQKVEDHALAGKHDARIVPQHRDGLAVVQAYSIENFRMAGNLIMRSHSSIQQRINVQDAGHAAQSRENALLFCDDGARGALPGINAGVAGGIAGGAVLQQCVLHNPGNPPPVPIHNSLYLGTENWQLTTVLPISRSQSHFPLRPSWSRLLRTFSRKTSSSASRCRMPSTTLGGALARNCSFPS